MGPNLIALAIPFFFVLIGIEVAVAWKMKRRVYRVGDALADLGCGIGQQMVSLFVTGVLLAGYTWLYVHARWVTLPVWAQWVAAFIGVDFLYYWWHRLSHEVNLLWAAHVVHHQSEDYNLAVALRQSVTTAFTSFPFYAPLAFLGVGTLPFATATALSTLYQFWIHTELLPPLPRFETVFNGPSAHRVHHAINARYIDRNYAATLMVWDRLFKTWEPETEEVVFGCSKPLNSFNALFAQVAGYLDLVAAARRAPSLSLALQVFVRSPGWSPGWMGEKPGVPQSRAEQGKYDVALSPLASTYAMGWFAIAITATFCLSMWGPMLSLPRALASATLVFLTLACVAGLLEHRRWVKVLEPVRLAALIAFVPLWGVT